MAKTLSSFEPTPDQQGVWSATKGALRCTALRLTDGTLCLYSPVQGLTEAALHSLSALGDVSVLLAPNHYHNKGLTEYVDAFPQAQLVCSDAARLRLIKQTGLAFDGLQTLASRLPAQCTLTEPAGLKTGEVWLTTKQNSSPLWIVCDSFKGPAGKTGHISDTVEILGTFPNFGVKDGASYAASVTQQLKTAAPHMIIPCHGSLIAGATLAPQIEAILDDLR